MTASERGISKTRFARYLECPRLGYLVSHPARYKHLAAPYDWMTLHLMGEGIRLGEMARERFPGGRLIGHTWDLDRACADTAAAMRDDDVQYIFEAAFASGGLLCRVDVLRKGGGAQVDLIEVKATNAVRAEHVPDAGFQLAVLEAAGLSVRSVGLMHFDPEYVHPGIAGDDCSEHGAGMHSPVHAYDLERLLTVDDITEEARAWVSGGFVEVLEAMRADLARPEAPRVSMRQKCRGCIYYRGVCEPGWPEHPVCELGNDRGGLFAALEDAGVYDLRAVPDDFPGLCDEHRLVLEAVRTGGLAVDRERARDLLAGLEFPLWFVDFETFMPGLPLQAGMRPWQQIPFQWSLHVLEAVGSLRHDEFLAEGVGDPRRAFAEALLAAVGESGSLVVYNRGMESARLQELARDFPDLADGLAGLDARIFDLLPVVRRCCYHLDFHGSRSLKVVTPVLAPHLSYEDLGLKGGIEAMEAYERIVDPGTPEVERKRLREELRTYCELDTLAMVEVLRRLWAEMEAA